MSKSLFILGLVLLFPLSLSAANLDQVEVLEMKYSTEGLEVKLKDQKITPNGYFYLILDREDEHSLRNIALILSKARNPKQDIKLIIKSFSPKPSGSRYRSSQIEIQGTPSLENLLK